MACSSFSIRRSKTFLIALSSEASSGPGKLHMQQDRTRHDAGHCKNGDSDHSPCVLLQNVVHTFRWHSGSESASRLCQVL